MQMEKRTSHVTENNKNVTSPNQQQSSNGGKQQQDMQVRELSETTANPSNLGNVSNIRDPRYSQEMMML